MIGRTARAGMRYASYARWLSKTRFSKRNGWTLPHSGTTVLLENLCDFLTTRDLYVGQHYKKLMDSVQREAIVWDIGMNLGAASLMFASHPLVKRVYGYEPMPKTFDCALKSIAMNPSLAPKIEPINLGIGASVRDVEVQYTSKLKSAIGICEISPFLKLVCRVKPSDFETQTMHLADADAVLEGMRRLHPDSQILMKLDAEGAEYEIIERLASTGHLQQISAMVIEWHGEPGPKHMLSTLHDRGFMTTTIDLEPGIGLIDAWQN